MPSTKTNTVIQSSSANAAGATKNSTMFTSTVDYGSTVVISMTNGATAPTLPCTANLQTSPDAGTTYYTIRTFTAGLATSTAYTFSWDVSPGIRYYRIQFTGNTGQSVTVYSYVDSLVSI